MADTFIDDLDWLPDELITSTKLNQWWANMQNFHNGTALGDGIILTRHLSDDQVTSLKLAEAFIRGRRQNDTTNTVVNGQRLQMGWGFAVGSGTSPSLDEAVTFPVPFSAPPIVICNYIGWRSAGTTPTSPSDFVGSHSGGGSLTCYAYDTTKSGFKVSMRLYVNFPNSQQQAYAWIAIGPA